MLKNVLLKTIFIPYCLSQNHRNLLRPSPAGRTAPSIGLRFFLSVTATSAVRFFHPMDARWCCPSTVFSFSFTPLFLFSFLITLYFYYQPVDQ